MEIQNTERDISALQTERTKLLGELNKLKIEIEDGEKTMNEILDGIPQKENYREQLDISIANLRWDPLLAQWDLSFESMHKTINGILEVSEKRAESQPGYFWILPEFRNFDLPWCCSRPQITC